MGKIYYKGKSYGEGGAAETKPVTATENEIVTGDGEEWLKASGVKVEDNKILLNDLFIEGKEDPKLKSIQFWNDADKTNSSNFQASDINYTINSITINNLTDGTKSQEVELNLKNISFNGYPFSTYNLSYTTGDTQATVYSAQTLVASITKSSDGSISVFGKDGSTTLANVVVTVNYSFEKDNSYEIIISTTARKATFNITNCEEEISGYYNKELKGIKLTIDEVVSEKKVLSTDKEFVFSNGSATFDLKGNATVKISDNATVNIKDGSHLSLGNNTRIVADGNSKVLLHDGCYLDLGGDAYNSSTQGSDKWDGVTFPKPSQSISPYCPGLIMHQSASIQADGAAALILHQAPWVEFAGNGTFVFGATAKDTSNGSYLSPKCHIINGEYYLGGDYSKYASGSYKLADDYPLVYLNSGWYSFNSEIQDDGKTYAPFLNFNGGGGITFNGSKNYNDPGLTPRKEKAKNFYPYLSCSQQEFQFDACLIANKSRNKEISADWCFDSADSFLSEQSIYPRFKIGSAVCMMIEGGRNTTYKDRTWIKIGAGTGNSSPSTPHSVIINICNNPTIEFNHDSSFMMKGCESGTGSYYDHLYPTSKEESRNGPIFKMLGKPYFSMKDNVTIDFHNNRKSGDPSNYYLNFGLTSPQSTESNYQNSDAANTCILTSRQIKKTLNYIWQAEIERGAAKNYLRLSVKPSEILSFSDLTWPSKSILTEENLNHLFSENNTSGGNLYIASPEGYSKTVINSESQVTLVDESDVVLVTITKDENGVISISSSLSTYSPALYFRSDSYNSTSFGSAVITTTSDATYTLEMPISSSCTLNNKIYSSYLPIGTLVSTEENRVLSVDNSDSKIFGEDSRTETYLGSMSDHTSTLTLGLDGAFGSDSNHCFISVGDNAKIKLRGNLSLSSNTETKSEGSVTSITITGTEEEGSVTFTIAELKALKALLS